MILLALAACQPALPPPQPQAIPDGLVIRGRGLRRVTVLDPQGVPLLTRRLPEPLDDLTLRLIWPESGAYQLQVEDAGGAHTLPLQVQAQALMVQVEAPVGQGQRRVVSGDVLPVVLVDGAPVQVAVTATALADGEGIVLLGGKEIARSPGMRAGERLVARAALSDDTPVEVRLEAAGGGEARVDLRLETSALTLEEARRRLLVQRVDFPAEAGGAPDLGRPEGRITLPAAWWRGLLGRTGLGARARDVTVPWAWYAVTLDNSGDRDLSVVVSLGVLGEDGQPARAFRPRLRDGDDGTGIVRALLRVPAGGAATGTLPLFVDEDLLSADLAAEGRWRSQIEVLSLGSGGAPVAQWSAPLYVSRGSAAASAGLAAALLGAAGGALLLLRQGPRWLAGAATSDLTTISLFGALTFMVGAAGRLATAGVAAALGPFAVLLTALVDDGFRYALLATLITLLPRPGTAALAALTGWLLAGVALDGFAPSGLIFITGRVLWLEGALYLFGVTRSTRWLDQPAAARWLRLSAAFGSASLLSSAAGLALSMALFRLYYADWYVALLLGGPGFLYVLAACAVAVPFADSLRRVQR